MRSKMNPLAGLLILALLLALLPLPASAEVVTDSTRSVTLRVGETVTLQNPASDRNMVFSAYTWSLRGKEVAAESHTAGSSTASVTALQPGRAILVGRLDGCFAQQNQLSSGYNDDTHTWDKFYYTTTSENYSYIYRFHITVLDPDGTAPAGPSFQEMTDQWEAEKQAAAEEARNHASGSCGAGVNWTFDTGTLTVSGSGKMKDYGQYDMQPWYGYDIRTVVVEEGVTHVGEYAFSSGAKGNWYPTIRQVRLAGSVKSVGDLAFWGASGLEEVLFSQGLETVGYMAFSGTAIKTLILPAGVKTVESGAFADCAELAAVYLPTGLETVGGGAFEGCASLTSVVVPDTVTLLGEGAFGFCDALEEVAVLGPVKMIYDWTFAFCPALRAVYLPKTVTEIETFAFDVNDNVPIHFYFAGTEAQWKKAAYDSVFKSWKLPRGITTHYGAKLPAMPQPPTQAGSTAPEDQAQAAAGSGSEPAPQTGVTAYERPQTVLLDGRRVILTTYALRDIRGNLTNYIWLRDLAVLLNGTQGQFDLGQQDGAAVLTRGEAYSGEPTARPVAGTRAGRMGTQSITVAGEAHLLEVLILPEGERNYGFVKLRDLARLLDIRVRWDNMVVIETGLPYAE